MIAGIGVDLVEIARIRALLERHGDRFLNRVFSPEELAYCRCRHDPAASLAARFAAKEALVKALGTGVVKGMRFSDIEVRGEGKPQINLTGKARNISEQMGLRCIHLSLSHERGHAIAMVIVEV